MRSYTLEEVLNLLEVAVENAEQDIYKDLKGADHEARLNSLDQLDMIDKVHRQIIIKLDREETSQ